MLTYENFVSVLLGVIERSGLNIAYTQELLDTHALGRSLSITCLPDGVRDDIGPQEQAREIGYYHVPTYMADQSGDLVFQVPLRAMIAFRWSPEFTVFSLRGADSLDNIERFVDERLRGHERRRPGSHEQRRQDAGEDGQTACRVGDKQHPLRRFDPLFLLCAVHHFILPTM